MKHTWKGASTKEEKLSQKTEVNTIYGNSEHSRVNGGFITFSAAQGTQDRMAWQEVR